MIQRMIDLPVPPQLAEQLRTWLRQGGQERAEANVTLKSGDRTLKLVHQQEGHLQDLDGARPRFILGLTAVRPDPPADFTGHPAELGVSVIIHLRQPDRGFHGARFIDGAISLSKDGYLEFKAMVETKGALLGTPGTTMERGTYHLVCTALGISPEAFDAQRNGGVATKGPAGATETKATTGTAGAKPSP